MFSRGEAYGVLAVIYYWDLKPISLPLSSQEPADAGPRRMLMVLPASPACKADYRSVGFSVEQLQYIIDEAGG